MSRLRASLLLPALAVCAAGLALLAVLAWALVSSTNPIAALLLSLALIGSIVTLLREQPREELGRVSEPTRMRLIDGGRK